MGIVDFLDFSVNGKGKVRFAQTVPLHFVKYKNKIERAGWLADWQAERAGR